MTSVSALPTKHLAISLALMCSLLGCLDDPEPAREDVAPNPGGFVSVADAGCFSTTDPAPACGEPCAHSCGCAACDISTTCIDGDQGSFVLAYSADRTCVEATPCAENEICGLTVWGMRGCVPVARLSGTATGLTEPAKLTVVWFVGADDVGRIEVPLMGDGPFVSPKLRSGASYAVTLEPHKAGCSVSHAVGSAGSPESAQINVTCGAATACDAAEYRCFPDTIACPYAGSFVGSVSGTSMSTESTTASCAADGAATPSATCCRPKR